MPKYDELLSGNVQDLLGAESFDAAQTRFLTPNEAQPIALAAAIGATATATFQPNERISLQRLNVSVSASVVLISSITVRSRQLIVGGTGVDVRRFSADQTNWKANFGGVVNSTDKIVVTFVNTAATASTVTCDWVGLSDAQV